MISEVEHFHFVEARHTRNPPLSTFERLLASGGICVDLTMSEKGRQPFETTAICSAYTDRVLASCSPRWEYIRSHNDARGSLCWVDSVQADVSHSLA